MKFRCKVVRSLGIFEHTGLGKRELVALGFVVFWRCSGVMNVLSLLLFVDFSLDSSSRCHALFCSM